MSEDVEMDIEHAEGTRQMTGDSRRHTDADSIRRHFGVPEFDESKYSYPHVFPNMIYHCHDGGPAGKETDKGGTDCLIRGKPGRGKSTLLLHLSLRVMSLNNEAVIWRGSTTRSEWLPFAKWARVCIPSGMDVSARLKPKDPTKDPIEVDLDDIVREVVRYDDPEHLNHECIQQGMFHVIYPDPEMTGCQAIYESADEKEYEDMGFAQENPDSHWWFAWLLSRIENGPHFWMTWILDEVGDLVPQSAQKDSHATYQKVEMFKDCFVDARRFGLSIYAAGHSETDIHEKIRRKMRWRIQTPMESNPTSKSDVIGFNSIPMESDFMSSASVGEILCYNERNFELLSYPEYPSPLDYTLKLSFE